MMIYQGKARYPVKGAVLHCAAVPSGWAVGKSAFQVFMTINQWHRERGFASFGYHGLFMPSGEFFPGRPVDQIGAHVIGHNAGTLGFCMIESRKIDAMGQFEDFFTRAQKDAVQRHLSAIHGLEWVKGHNDFGSKLCPGFKVQPGDWNNGLRALTIPQGD